MEPVANDRWPGSFTVDRPGRWTFTVKAWVDRFESWRDELRRKVEAGQTDLDGELAEGAALLKVLRLDVETALAGTERDRSEETRLLRDLGVDADRERARFGSWYELFPRSWGGFAGVERVLPELADLGFDVVYLPPIHPIGRTNRKGRNNAPAATPGDPGSPWAIGGGQGGHTAVDPGARHDRGLRPARRRRPASTGSRSRSTSRSSARPTTRGCASTRSGSTAGPTAR